MSNNQKVFDLVHAAGKGWRSIAQVRKQFQSSDARRIWGFPPFLLLPVLASACFAFSFVVPFGIRSGNPFTMGFPGQVATMAVGIALSPLTLFATFCGWWLQNAIKRGRLVPMDLEKNQGSLGLPLLVSGFFLVAMYQVFLSYPYIQDGITFFMLVHSFGNMMFLSAWLAFFTAAATASKGLGVGKMMTGFFWYHAFFFALSFFPSFGLLDFLTRNFLSLNYGNSSWGIGIASILKALAGIGVVGIFWMLAQEKMKRQLGIPQVDALPPVPVTPPEGLPPLPEIPKAPTGESPVEPNKCSD